MTAFKKRSASPAVRQCVFILPGAALIGPEQLSGQFTGDILVTQMVSEALAFEPDHWILVVPDVWTPSLDPVLEHARVRDLSRVLAAAADALFPTSFAMGGDPGEKLGEVQASSLPEALAIYATGSPSKGGAANLPLSMFSFGRGLVSRDRGNVCIDLTGGTRPLAWGPHVALPSGRWILRLNFELSNILPGRRIRFEWGHMSDFISQDLTFDLNGRYQLDLEAEWKSADLSEMRVLLPTGAFAGELSLTGCQIERA